MLQPVIKVGMVPFWIDPEGSLHVLLLRPTATKPHLPPPQLQLCKGTAHWCGADGVWHDGKDEMPSGDIEWEAPEMTAIREAEEELALDVSAIVMLYGLGETTITSSTTGEEKPIELFGAHMHSREVLGPETLVSAITAERRWVAETDIAVADIKPDHREIVQRAMAALRALAIL